MSNGSLLSKEHVDFVEYVSGNHLQLNIIMEVKQRGTPQLTLCHVLIILCGNHCMFSLLTLEVEFVFGTRTLTMIQKSHAHISKMLLEADFHIKRLWITSCVISMRTVILVLTVKLVRAS